MKKLLLILLLAVSFVNAQNIIVSSKNSTTTALDSAATYTGTAELNTNYSYLTIVVKSNVSSASNGVIVKMGTTASALNTNQFFTYTVNDSSTNRFTVHLTGKYFKVMYINGTTNQTTFDLKTYMHMEEVLPVDANGNIKVNVASLTLTQAQIDSLQKAVQQGTWNINNISGTISLPTGAATSANQTTLLGYTHPSNVEWVNNTQTVSTEVDTISITATTWYNFSVFSVNDTIEVSLSGSFATPKIAYPYTAIDKYLNVSPVTYPKIYIRRKGTGTATYNYSGEGY